jgi:hypothetical protein
MLILKHRSRCVTVSILGPVEAPPSRPYFTVLLQQCSFYTPSFCSFIFMLILATDFTSPAFHVTGAFYHPVPASHSQSIHIHHRSLYAVFCLLSLRSPLDSLAIHSHYTAHCIPSIPLFFILTGLFNAICNALPLPSGIPR